MIEQIEVLLIAIALLVVVHAIERGVKLFSSRFRYSALLSHTIEIELSLKQILTMLQAKKEA